MIKRQGIIVYLYYNRDLRKIAISLGMLSTILIRCVMCTFM